MRDQDAAGPTFAKEGVHRAAIGFRRPRHFSALDKSVFPRQLLIVTSARIRFYIASSTGGDIRSPSVTFCAYPPARIDYTGVVVAPLSVAPRPDLLSF